MDIRTAVQSVYKNINLSVGSTWL